MITNIAAFHFAMGHEDPIRELLIALDGASEDSPIGKTLVVLPEGFNLGRSYNVDPARKDKITLESPKFDASCMLQILSSLAAARPLLFVVGIIEVDPATKEKSNCAYLIEGGREPRLLCRKINEDHSGEYTPCTSDCEGQNPVEIGGLRLGALLCMDATCQHQTNSDVARRANARRKTVLADLRNDPPSVLCVPGAFSTERRWDRVPDLSGVWVIVANSIAGSASQVVDCCGNQVATCKGSDNHLLIVDIQKAIATEPGGSC